jgi:hypothetical protein
MTHHVVPHPAGLVEPLARRADLTLHSALIALFDNETLAALHVYCLASGEDPTDVVRDALALHLDLEAGPEEEGEVANAIAAHREVMARRA